MAHFYNSCLLSIMDVIVSSPKNQLFLLSPLCLQTRLIYITSRHSAIERKASTRILHLILFLASVLISIQVFLTLLASSSTVLSPLCLQTRLIYLTSRHSAIEHKAFHKNPPSHSILGCRVDSASNRNEYQEYFLGVKAASA